MVPYDVLDSIELQAGETVITARATGSFGGEAVLVAPATGARVIAMGRNGTALHKLKRMLPMPDRFEVIHTREDVMGDYEALQRYGQVDTSTWGHHRHAPARISYHVIWHSDTAGA